MFFIPSPSHREPAVMLNTKMLEPLYLSFTIIAVFLNSNHRIIHRFPLQIAHSIPIDNGVEGAPEITCHQDAMAVIVFTRNVFEGHMYVKGRYDEQNCRTDDTRTLEASIRLPFTECGVRRIRQVNPRGVSVEATVVVSFHPQFITKVDRAYHIKCFYMEADKTVNSELDVSMLTTIPYTEQAPMPSCRYTVLRSADDTTPIRYARVGDSVYHKWTCDQTTDEMYCMTVHSCTVDDGAGVKIQLLDEDGCALDQYLIGNLNYLSDLMAGRESHVFKYADKPNLFFNCQIRLFLKEGNDLCQRQLCTDPLPGGRKKRFTSNEVIEKAVASELSLNVSSSADVDVTSDPIMVFDIEHVGEEFEDQYQKPARRSENSNRSSICIDRTMMTFIWLALGVVAISGAACVMAYFWRRWSDTRKEGQHDPRTIQNRFHS